MADPLDNLTSGEQLRRLLFQEEQERIDRLEARLGNDDNLKISLIPIIADVLREAGVQDYRRLARALAPIVLESIKTEIHNSRDMMVDALYPITGRLVSAAVRNAFRDMVEQLNQKLDQTLSADRWRARIKAKMTGRSEAEILLSEGAAFEITNLLLIDRESGRLMAKAGSEGGEADEADSELFGSILTAIMAFVRDAMRDKPEQDLRTLHVGDIRLHLQTSPTGILAIKTKGPPPAGFDRALSDSFCAFLGQWGETLSAPDELDGDEEVAIARDLEERFQSLLQAKQSNFRAPSKKGVVLLAGIALLAIGLIGWRLYDRLYQNRIETTARTVIAGLPSLAGYPLRVAYESGENTLDVTGLTPDQTSLTRLKAGLAQALPETGMVVNVQALPEQQSVALDHLATKDNLTRSAADLKAGLAAVLDSQMAALESRVVTIDGEIAAIDRKTTGLGEDTEEIKDTLARIKPMLPTERERKIAAFRSWIDRQPIRFVDGDRFEDDDRVDEILQGIALRLFDLPADVGLLIIGYADESGVADINEKVSLERADLVARRLQSLGAPPERLITVGRSSENRISQEIGRTSANRRVEIDLTYRHGDDDGR